MPERRDEYLLDRSGAFTVTTGGETRTDLTLIANPAVTYERHLRKGGG
jgi:hypothetical protein